MSRRIIEHPSPGKIMSWTAKTPSKPRLMLELRRVWKTTLPGRIIMWNQEDISRHLLRPSRACELTTFRESFLARIHMLHVD
jgi:hypothetical protein